MHKIEKYRASKTFNLGRLIQMVPDQRSLVEFLQCVNVLPTTLSCSKCQADCSDVIYPEKGHYVHFYCQPCRTKCQSGKIHSFIGRTYLSEECYCWPMAGLNWPGLTSRLSKYIFFWMAGIRFLILLQETSMTSDESDREESESGPTSLSTKTINRFHSFFR